MKSAPTVGGRRYGVSLRNRKPSRCATLHVHAPSARVNAARLGTPAQRLLPLKNELAPFGLGASVADAVIVTAHAIATDDFVQDLHPAVLVMGAVSIEVDDLAVVEADAEALFDKHVALFFLGEGRSPALTTLAGGLLLRERLAIIDQALRIGQIDSRAGLTGGFMVRRELGTDELEESATPVLKREESD